MKKLAVILALSLTTLLAGDVPPTSRIEGALLVESADGHPGTPFAVVRVVDEADRLASITRLSLRPETPLAAEPGLGPCLTFQAKLEPSTAEYDAPDVTLGHICFRLNDRMGAEMVVYLRASDGTFHEVIKTDAEDLP